MKRVRKTLVYQSYNKLMYNISIIKAVDRSAVLCNFSNNKALDTNKIENSVILN